MTDPDKLTDKLTDRLIWPRFDLVPPRARAYAYRVSSPAIALLGAHGIIAEHTVTLWMALVTAILNTGLAAAHTETRRDPRYHTVTDRSSTSDTSSTDLSTSTTTTQSRRRRWKT